VPDGIKLAPERAHLNLWCVGKVKTKIKLTEKGYFIAII
jgi:uncharacterized membrane protein YiaA